MDVAKQAYYQAEGMEEEDLDDDEDESANPRDVGHNIYILAHQVRRVSNLDAKKIPAKHQCKPRTKKCVTSSLWAGKDFRAEVEGMCSLIAVGAAQQGIGTASETNGHRQCRRYSLGILRQTHRAD